MTGRIRLTITIFLIIFLSGCENSVQPMKSVEFFAMNTVVNIQIVSDDKQILVDLEDEMLRLEGLWSTTKSTSDIGRINNKSGDWADISQETAALLISSLAYCDKTGGALNIALYPVSRLWGFTTGNYTVPCDEAIEAALYNIQYEIVELEENRVFIEEGMAIDLGAVVKGYTSDRMVQLLKNKGIESGVIDLGGNISVLGKKGDGAPWKVGIKNPFDGGICATIAAEDISIVTSGSYERYFMDNNVRYHHIIDPATGQPAQSGLVSVTIITQSGFKADCLSTALFVMGKDKAVEYWRAEGDFDMVLIDDNGGISYTKGIEDSIEVKDNLDSQVIE